MHLGLGLCLWLQPWVRVVWVTDPPLGWPPTGLSPPLGWLPPQGCPPAQHYIVTWRMVGRARPLRWRSVLVCQTFCKKFFDESLRSRRNTSRGSIRTDSQRLHRALFGRNGRSLTCSFVESAKLGNVDGVRIKIIAALVCQFGGPLRKGNAGNLRASKIATIPQFVLLNDVVWEW